MKVSELEGAELDYWAAKAQGWINYPDDSREQGTVWHLNPKEAPFGKIMAVKEYTPSTNWEQCGELIEQFNMDLGGGPEYWVASVGEDFFGDKTSLTPRIAICRAVVASVFGEKVSG